jgi:hypothetical protein
VDPTISVLFNRRPNDTQSGDDGLRTLPPRSPGTPRHPAYPSGHSTTYAAGSELLASFFPDLRAEFEQLADNAGMARLWAGIHYRSDHLWGMEVGRRVAQLVVEQVRASCIPIPDPCRPPCTCQEPPKDKDADSSTSETEPPADAEVEVAAMAHRCCCRDYEPPAAPLPRPCPTGQLPELDPNEQPEIDVEKDERELTCEDH